MLPAAALAVALGVLWLPSPSAAVTIAEPALGSSVTSSRFEPELTLHTSSGYRVTVSERRGAVALTVSRQHGKHSLTATSYLARGTATAARLQASFGRLGRISMRFRPSAAKARLVPGGRCHGIGTRLTRRGVFVGSFRFRGEGGYAAVHLHRAKGTISHLARSCLRRGHGHRRERLIRPSQASAESEIPFLAALWKGATASKTFIALKTKTKPLFLGTTSGDDGKVSIFRIVLAIGKAGEFRLDRTFTGARVSPGPPFSGAATYSAAPDGTKAWEGPLAVNFPGAPRLALTGPPLETTVGTIPPLLALFLLKAAKAGDALALAATEQPSLLATPTP